MPMPMLRTDRKWLPISPLALCGAVLWGVVEALALLRSRRAARNGEPSV